MSVKTEMTEVNCFSSTQHLRVEVNVGSHDILWHIHSYQIILVQLHRDDVINIIILNRLEKP